MKRCRAKSSWILALWLCWAAQGCGPEVRDDGRASGPAVPTPKSVEIAGQVTLEDAEDSGGIQVFIPGATALAMTDAQGRFSIPNVALGTYALRAQYSGYTPIRFEEITIPETFAMDRYVLQPKVLTPLPRAGPDPSALLGSIQGYVSIAGREASGAGLDLSGRRIELVGTPMRTFTDSDGAFYLWSLAPGSYVLQVSGAGFETFQTDIEVNPGGISSLAEIALRPLGIELPEGAINGMVEMILADETLGADFSPVVIGLLEAPDLYVPVSPDGEFRIEGLPAGIYTLFAHAEGFDSTGDLIVDLIDIESAEVTMTLRSPAPDPNRPGSVLGVVVKNIGPGADMSGVTVALAGTSMVALTDSDGRFEISGVRPATYELLARSEGFEPVTLVGLEVAPGARVELEELVLEPIYDFPVVIESSPLPGSDDVLVQIEMPIFIRFSKKMTPDSLRRSLSIQPSVPYEVFVGKEHQQTDFDLMMILIDGGAPDNPVRYDTRYRVTISEEAEDFDSLALQEPFELEFRTGRAAVMDTIPADGATGVILQPSKAVVIRFNAALKHTTIDPRDIVISPSLIVVPTVQSIDDPRTGWTSIHIQATWRQDTRYQIRIPRKIRTATGQTLSNTPYTFRLRTAKLVPLPPVSPRVR